VGTKFSDDQAAAHVEVRDLYLTKTDVVSSLTTFIGQAIAQDTLDSAEKWRISRVSISGTEPTVEFANKGKIDQIWDNRASLFGAIPFSIRFSLFFDGANDFLDIADNASIGFDLRSEAASWNLWMRTSDTTATVTYFDKLLGANGWSIQLAAGRLLIDMRGTGGGADRLRVRGPVGTGAIINDGEWHMLTVTYDGSGNASGVSLFVDGAVITPDIQNDALVTTTDVVGNAALGAASGGGSNYGPGHIDEASIWDIELTSAQVTTIFNSGVPIDLQAAAGGISASLNYWSRMGDGDDDIFPNIEDIENNINGVMTNMTAGDIQTVVPS